MGELRTVPTLGETTPNPAILLFEILDVAYLRAP